MKGKQMLEELTRGCGDGRSRWLFIHDGLHGYRLAAMLSPENELSYRISGPYERPFTYREINPMVDTLYLTGKDDVFDAVVRPSNSKSARPSVESDTVRLCSRWETTYSRHVESLARIVVEEGLSDIEALNQPEYFAARDVLLRAAQANCAWASRHRRGIGWLNKAGRYLLHNIIRNEKSIF